jgi:hypothetical protein
MRPQICVTPTNCQEIYICPWDTTWHMVKIRINISPVCIGCLQGNISINYSLFFLRSSGDVTITGEGLQNLGLCLTLRAFEQAGIFIVPHLLWHGISVFPVSSEGPPHSVASYQCYTQTALRYSPLSPLLSAQLQESCKTGIQNCFWYI